MGALRQRGIGEPRVAIEYETTRTLDEQTAIFESRKIERAGDVAAVPGGHMVENIAAALTSSAVVTPVSSSIGIPAFTCRLAALVAKTVAFV